ncbi:MAG: hypothetical protein AAGM67_21900, partial [Bacteroidota bacterium]
MNRNNLHNRWQLPTLSRHLLILSMVIASGLLLRVGNAGASSLIVVGSSTTYSCDDDGLDAAIQDVNNNGTI